METDALGMPWIYGLSAIAGVVGFAQTFSFEDTWKRSALKLAGRLGVSIFAGMMTYHFAIAIGVPKSWIFLAVGIGAWRGDKGLQAIADAWDRRTTKSAEGDGK